MTPKLLALLGALGMALPATAWAQSSADTDGDGVLTLTEVQAANPEVDPETFVRMDANGDAVLDSEEVAAAQQAGLLPASDG
ncbi:hypothetical protein KQ247_19580 [Ruegeria pomeroyi]|uniref:EF-hand domain-containing protein n=2 Tax=Ruegeria pomeroyi TaxID=89184 RepID=Q5LRJ2_RUEPO|nr:hypothetical protein [Ruegeria pomeroyi]HCE70795.1 hypothetical protein [Ruegeria sp.]AAV95404.1 hypothetical protein SPO2135 [Ruegeria pomeroyi DSS-3]NVK96892.1 hypothetical protein [Ruegeria pomeroyi]NVL02794.1 hypothetical protein [Ruegeria pomeroyi]QWV08970.1 hypothetical protein KQ247_19580 [Ruegeria pomeroyi]